jgi:hypothetical protein
MGTKPHITPRTPGSTPWRASTLRDRVTGALTRLSPATRDELAAYTGDPRTEVDALINELLVDGLVVPVLDRYRYKSPRERYERQVTLHDGTVVGSWSPEWNTELEGRAVLRMPTKMHRQGYLIRVRERRGDARANAMEELLLRIFRSSRAARDPAGESAMDSSHGSE